MALLPKTELQEVSRRREFYPQSEDLSRPEGFLEFQSFNPLEDYRFPQKLPGRVHHPLDLHHCGNHRKVREMSLEPSKVLRDLHFPLTEAVGDHDFEQIG